MNLYLYYVALPLIFIVFLVVVVVRRSRRSGGDLIAPLTDGVILEIKVPKTDELHTERNGPLAAQQMFASLHGLLHEDYLKQEHFSFEIASSGTTGIRFYVAVPRHIVTFLESQIYAQYPTAQITEVPDYTGNISQGDHVDASRLTLTKEQFFPIKTFRDFEVDPLSSVTSALTQVMGEEQLWFQLLVRPVADVWQKEGYDYVNSIRSGDAFKPKSPGIGGAIVGIFSSILLELLHVLADIPRAVLIGNPTTGVRPGSNAGPPPKEEKRVQLTPSQDLELTSIEEKLTSMGFEVNIRFVSSGADPDRVKSNLRSLAASFRQFSTAHLNAFQNSGSSETTAVLDEYRSRTFNSTSSYILSIDELGSTFHLPSQNVETPNIDWIFSKKAEPPASLPVNDCTYIGETIFRSQRVKFGIKNGDDRLRHMYLIGKSGTGKSTLFQTLITQDIQNGAGVGVLDPHGELIEDILNYIPDHRVNDVILIDPSDTERPVGLNLLEIEDQSQKNLMASNLISAIKVHFDYSWGPRLEYLLNYAVLTLLEVPGTSMLGITRLLGDKNYRNYILHQVKDPVVLEFWEKEYKEMSGNQKLVTEAIAPIQNKINRFLSSTTIRNILGQRKSTVDIWDAMNSGKILLMNLSKGKIGEDNANLLGALLVSRIQFMALQRAKLPPQERRPFYLYVDEFQNFAGGSFESILSESRKYKLGLYLTHQYTSQLPEQLLQAVFGNVGTIASFSLGAPDAKVLANEYAPYFDQQDIISLDRFHIYIKMMIDGMTSKPFSARILLPWKPDEAIVPKTSNKEQAIAQSRERYGTDRTMVEDIIRRWIERQFDKGAAIAEEKQPKPESIPGQIQNL